MDNLNAIFTSSPDEELTTTQTLSIIGFAALAAMAISWLPIINWLDYPFRLLITLVHELGHGIGAMITGGDFVSFTISLDGSGRAYSGQGWRSVVIPAGYLSVAIFSAFLITLGRSHRWSRMALGLIGIVMLLLTLCYARPGTWNLSSVFEAFLTLGLGLIFGAMFVWIAAKSSPSGIIFFLHLIAIKAGFTAFTDIFIVIRLAASGAGIHNDAQSMANLTGIPAIVWGVFWVVMSAVFIGGAIWSTWLIPDDEEEAIIT